MVKWNQQPVSRTDMHLCSIHLYFQTRLSGLESDVFSEYSFHRCLYSFNFSFKLKTCNFSLIVSLDVYKRQVLLLILYILLVSHQFPSDMGQSKFLLVEFRYLLSIIISCCIVILLICVSDRCKYCHLIFVFFYKTVQGTNY